MPRKSQRQRIEERAQGRCEYCKAPQIVCAYHFHLDHIIPLALGGSDNDDNRTLACAYCNLAKSDRVMGRDPQTGDMVDLFNPRRQNWSDHLQWSNDRLTLIGLTAIGRATIATLNMNNPLFLAARPIWVAMGLLPQLEGS